MEGGYFENEEREKKRRYYCTDDSKVKIHFGDRLSGSVYCPDVSFVLVL